MKHTSEWKFVRKNSKGESILRRDTNETLEEVLDFLKDIKGIEVEVFLKATLISIYVDWRRYDYYWTTGRWCQRKSNYPKTHYHSKGIEDFCNRFLKKDIKNYSEEPDTPLVTETH